MAATEKTRSNRPLTEFACNILCQFLTGKYIGEGNRSRGNTIIAYCANYEHQSLSVSIFGANIFSIKMKHWSPVEINVSFGGYYDVYGQPTTTTIERLNGLFNRLAIMSIIPDNVRVFRDQSQKLTYFGRFEEKVAVGERYATEITIKPLKSALIFSSNCN